MMNPRWVYFPQPGEPYALGPHYSAHLAHRADNGNWEAVCGCMVERVYANTGALTIPIEHRCGRCLAVEMGASPEELQGINADGRQAHPVELVGPFDGEHYRLTVEGCEVPYIVGRCNPDSDAVELTLDRRFAVTTNQAELRKWAWFLAHAMAISAGYTCHGKQSAKINPFAKGLIGVSFVDKEADHAN